MPVDKPRPPIGCGADPAYWSDGIRGKLCFLHGWTLAKADGYEDFAMLHECTDEQILDSIIRMLLRQKAGEQAKKHWWQS